MSETFYPAHSRDEVSLLREQNADLRFAAELNAAVMARRLEEMEEMRENHEALQAMYDDACGLIRMHLDDARAMSEVHAKLAASERAAAAMREALVAVELSNATLLGDGQFRVRQPSWTEAKEMVRAALASDAGRGWVSPEEHARVRGALVQWQAWLESFEADTRALPLNAEDKSKGASCFNWRMGFVREARAALGDKP